MAFIRCCEFRKRHWSLNRYSWMWCRKYRKRRWKLNWYYWIWSYECWKSRKSWHWQTHDVMQAYKWMYGSLYIELMDWMSFPQKNSNMNGWKSIVMYWRRKKDVTVQTASLDSNKYMTWCRPTNEWIAVCVELMVWMIFPQKTAIWRAEKAWLCIGGKKDVTVQTASFDSDKSTVWYWSFWCDKFPPHLVAWRTQELLCIWLVSGQSNWVF